MLWDDAFKMKVRYFSGTRLDKGIMTISPACLWHATNSEYVQVVRIANLRKREEKGPKYWEILFILGFLCLLLVFTCLLL